MKSFTNRDVRLLQHDRSIVVEDDLDTRWEELTGEVVDEVIFFSRHTAVSNRPALTVHPIGMIPLFLYSLSLMNRNLNFGCGYLYSKRGSSFARW